MALVALSISAYAEDYALPDRMELSSYSPEALAYYTDGVRALDRTDFTNAYSSLLKAAQLQPDAMRLNMMVAALALREGRSATAADAEQEYESAVWCYNNVLRLKSIDESTRRMVLNKLKMSMQERDPLRLAQRDARREAMGTQFITKLNQEFVNSKSALTPEKKTKTLAADKTVLLKKAVDSPKADFASAQVDDILKMAQFIQKQQEAAIAAAEQQQQGQGQMGGMQMQPQMNFAPPTAAAPQGNPNAGMALP